MVDIECVVDIEALVGECPLWCASEQVLYWVEIDAKLIHRYDPSTGIDEVRSTPGRPGSLALTATPGRFLLAAENELLWFEWANGSVEPWIELEPADRGNRLNDGRCDPAGRFVVGSMWPDTSERIASGMLHQVEADGAATVLRTEIGVSNGIAFDADRGLAYFADTPAQTVWVSDHDIETGERRNERVFIDYRELPGAPDGGCVDADGCYWSASVHGYAVIRVTPDGHVDRRIELPVENPTMPAFGGADLTTLYVTSIGGGLYAINAGVQGRPEPLFGG